MTENIEMLIREARGLDAEIKVLDEQKAALVERIKKELAVGETVTVDGVRATLRPGNRKFSTAKALQMMPEDAKLQCVVTKIDEKLVRQTADALGLTEQCYDPAPADKTVLDLTK